MFIAQAKSFAFAKGTYDSANPKLFVFDPFEGCAEHSKKSTRRLLVWEVGF
jgi:hypothetical protein